MNTRIRLKQALELYRPFIGPFALLSGVTIVMQTLNLISPYVYGRIVDGLLRHMPARRLLGYAFLIAGCMVIRNMLGWFSAWYNTRKLSFAAEEHFDEITLRRVMKLSLGQLLNQNSGFRVEIIKRGSGAVLDLAERAHFDIVPTLFRVLTCTIALFILNAWMGLVLCAGVFGYIASSIVINKYQISFVRELRRRQAAQGTVFWEIMKHLRLVILSNGQKSITSEYMTGQRSISAFGNTVWARYFVQVTLIREPFITISQLGLLCVGIYLVTRGQATPGTLVIAMGWAMSVFGAIESLGSIQRRLTENLVNIGAYFRLLEMEPAVVIPPNPVKPKHWQGKIEFRNVSFEYPKFEDPDGEPKKPVQSVRDDTRIQAIHDVSFTIEPGTVTAFVGHSGAGKSTIVNLILRGYDPTKGQILVDGNDSRVIDIESWRKAVGVVEQDPRLWDHTLRYNMLFGQNGHAHAVSEDELEQLAHRTRISEFFDRLGPKRFDTRIGENGVQLSGGQRQRVAIARAIGKSPSILILDEATNALDPHNEHLIHEAIREALKGRTGIIIAHRLSTIRHADQIIIFEQGRVVGIGTHQELMKSCEAYSRLVVREVGTLTEVA